MNSTFHHFPPHWYSLPPKRTSQYPQGSFLGISQRSTPGRLSAPVQRPPNLGASPPAFRESPLHVVVVAQLCIGDLRSENILRFPKKKRGLRSPPRGQPHGMERHHGLASTRQARPASGLRQSLTSHRCQQSSPANLEPPGGSLCPAPRGIRRVAYRKLDATYR